MIGGIARGCYAAELGDCSGPLNREHFISKTILKDFEESAGLHVTGYPYGNSAGFLMSAASMSAKVLCENHNNGLSNVDAEGSRFLLAFFNAHVGLLEKKFTTDVIYECDGPLIERWMLKYICGLVASGQTGTDIERISKTVPPLGFIQVLFGIETLPTKWGLYTRATNPVGVSESKELAFAPYLPLQRDGTHHLAGVKMRHYGFTSILALKTPQEPFAGTDLDQTIHRPAFFKFFYRPTGRSVTITIKWPSPKTGAGFVLNLHKGALP
jgi:hypothetical protein